MMVQNIIGKNVKDDVECSSWIQIEISDERFDVIQRSFGTLARYRNPEYQESKFTGKHVFTSLAFYEDLEGLGLPGRRARRTVR